MRQQRQQKTAFYRSCMNRCACLCTERTMEKSLERICKEPQNKNEQESHAVSVAKTRWAF